MIRQQRGFSLVELMITIVIFIMVIAASSQIFTALLTQFKQQSKIGETDIEGAIGLDILRRDLAHAGLGLPGSLNGVDYEEAVDDGGLYWNDKDLNDGPPDNPGRGTEVAGASNPPGAFRGKNDQGIHNSDAAAGATNVAIVGSSADVLAIKATNVAMSEAAQRWTYVTNTGASNTIKGWGTGAGALDNFVPGDKVVVMKPDPTGRVNILQKSGAIFWTTFASSPSDLAADFQPAANSYESFVMYGVERDAASLRMPFNRADYYVKRPASGMPGRCAPRTGILYKAMLNQSDGKHTELPILDCVADLQVKFCVDVAATPNPAAPTLAVRNIDYIDSLTAAELRSRLKDVQVYVVAQEGQRDASYDFSNNNTRVRFRPMAYCGTDILSSQEFDMVDLSGLVNVDKSGVAAANEYKRYNWRLYSIVSRPTSLR